MASTLSGSFLPSVPPPLLKRAVRRANSVSITVTAKGQKGVRRVVQAPGQEQVGISHYHVRLPDDCAYETETFLFIVSVRPRKRAREDDQPALEQNQVASVE